MLAYSSDSWISVAADGIYAAKVANFYMCKAERNIY